MLNGFFVGAPKGGGVPAAAAGLHTTAGGRRGEGEGGHFSFSYTGYIIHLLCDLLLLY